MTPDLPSINIDTHTYIGSPRAKQTARQELLKKKDASTEIVLANPTAPPPTRQAAKAALNVQIKKFQQHILSMPKQKQTQPDKSLMQSFFDAKQMSALWGRLKAARQSAGKDTMNIADAWNDLCKIKTGSQKAKNDVLFLYIIKGDWQQKLLVMTNTVSRSTAVTEQEKKMSRGELNQLVGEEEAERDIKKGKYIELQDEWGDKIYIKKTTTVTREKKTQRRCLPRGKNLRHKKKLMRRLKVLISG